jgi:hypothetical protein
VSGEDAHENERDHPFHRSTPSGINELRYLAGQIAAPWAARSQHAAAKAQGWPDYPQKALKPPYAQHGAVIGKNPIYSNHLPCHCRGQVGV